MGSLFSKSESKKQPAAKRTTDVDKKIVQMKKVKQDLKSAKRRMEAEMEKLRELAVKLVKDGRKEAAKAVLLRKKGKEKLLRSTEAQMTRVEEMISGVEMASQQAQLVDALKMGSDAVEAIKQGFGGVDAVEDLMDRIAEQRDEVEAVAQILGEPVSDVDESELDDAYALMMAEINKEKMDKLPEVPVAEPSAQEPAHPEADAEEQPVQQEEERELVPA